MTMQFAEVSSKKARQSDLNFIACYVSSTFNVLHLPAIQAAVWLRERSCPRSLSQPTSHGKYVYGLVAVTSILTGISG